MFPKLIVASRKEVEGDQNINTDHLWRKHLYKVLSLVEAARARIRVPPTLLLLGMNRKILSYVIKLWKLPLMVRMDFGSLPKRKTLGGIPIYSKSSLIAIAKFLFRENCYPIFHPHLDRFKDVYSVGIMIDPSSPVAHIEVVGKGFDASDLRLGESIPHESIKIDVFEFSILYRSFISHSDYLNAKIIRNEKVRKLQKYIKYANHKGKLLPSLNLSDKDTKNKIEDQVFIPERYIPLPDNHLSYLIEITSILYSKVLKNLPYSKTFVASLSYLAESGWVLWDVYGQWYRR